MKRSLAPMEGLNMGGIVPSKAKFRRGSHAFNIDWDKEFDRHRPATPQPPCDVCQEHESDGVCVCGTPLCNDCIDFHFAEAHGR